MTFYTVETLEPMTFHTVTETLEPMTFHTVKETMEPMTSAIPMECTSH